MYPPAVQPISRIRLSRIRQPKKAVTSHFDKKYAIARKQWADRNNVELFGDAARMVGVAQHRLRVRDVRRCEVGGICGAGCEGGSRVAAAAAAAAEQ